MGIKIINDIILYNIGNAIRDKTDITERLKPSEMPSAIDSIETYPEPTGSISIAENGTTNVKDYASAVVNVPNSYEASDEGKVVDDGTLVVQGSQTITENGTYDTTLIDELIANIAGGGGANILTGTDTPASSLGGNGDVYLQYVKTGVKNVSGQYINTNYRGNNNSKYEIVFAYDNAQTSQYPTPFGARASAGALGNGSYIHTGYNYNHNESKVVWGASEMNAFSFGDSFMIDKVVKAELSAGSCVLTIDAQEYEYSFTPQSVVDTTPIGIFAMMANGVAQSYTYTDGMILYDFKVYENNVLVHRYIPSIDTNDVVCIYDEVDETYLYVNSGTLEYIEEGEIRATYLKVNGAWQELIGSDVNDVTT